MELVKNYWDYGAKEPTIICANVHFSHWSQQIQDLLQVCYRGGVVVKLM